MRRVRRLNHLRRLASMLLCDGSIRPTHKKATTWLVRFTNTDRAQIDYVSGILEWFGPLTQYKRSSSQGESVYSVQAQRGGSKKRKTAWDVRLLRQGSVERCLTAIRPWLVGIKRRFASQAIKEIRQRHGRAA